MHSCTLILLAASFICPVATVDDDATSLQDINKATETLKKVLTQNGREKLAKLSESLDLMVSLFSTWEMYKGKESDIARFIDVFEKKLDVKAPSWWKQCILHVRVRPDGLSHFVDLNLRPLVSKEDRSNLAKDDYKIRMANLKMSFLGPYRIEAANEVKKVHWSAEVWARGKKPIGMTGRPSPRLVELMIEHNRLFVFGADWQCVFAEVFDLPTGKPLVRFCTSYWSDYSEAWGLR